VRHDEVAELVNLNEVMEQVAELTRSYWHAEAKSRDVHIALRTDLQSRRSVLGSAAELREVFTNLVLNAVDAMPDGGTIVLATEDRDGRVLGRVTDDGIGMDEATRVRIFDPFFTTKPKKGTGLGLSVAYGILRRHHAEIAVDSAPREGTTFRLLFPVCDLAPTAAPPAAEVPALPRFTALCVDDEAAVLDVVADLLEELGQTVERANGGKSGIERALASRPEIVFTDLGMPDVNGWEVARAVKEAAPETVVCMVTGWGMQLDPEPTRSLGVDLILPKPFTVDDIRRVLAEAAELKRTLRAA
jgi:CheY-like chemotaxis protein